MQSQVSEDNLLTHEEPGESFQVRGDSDTTGSLRAPNVANNLEGPLEFAEQGQMLFL